MKNISIILFIVLFISIGFNIYALFYSNVGYENNSEVVFSDFKGDNNPNLTLEDVNVQNTGGSEKLPTQVNNQENIYGQIKSESVDYSLFNSSRLKLNEDEQNKISNLCSEKNTFASLQKFKVNNEGLFRKVFLGFDGSDYFSDKGEKNGFYFYDNCDFLSNDKGVYGECLLRTNLKNIFLNNGVGVINISELPFDMKKLNDEIVSGNCGYIKEKPFFKEFYDSCNDKDLFIDKMNIETKELISNLCEK